MDPRFPPLVFQFYQTCKTFISTSPLPIIWLLPIYICCILWPARLRAFRYSYLILSPHPPSTTISTLWIFIARFIPQFETLRHRHSTTRSKKSSDAFNLYFLYLLAESLAIASLLLHCWFHDVCTPLDPPHLSFVLWTSLPLFSHPFVSFEIKANRIYIISIA